MSIEFKQARWKLEDNEARQKSHATVWPSMQKAKFGRNQACLLRCWPFLPSARRPVSGQFWWWCSCSKPPLKLTLPTPGPFPSFPPDPGMMQQDISPWLVRRISGFVKRRCPAQANINKNKRNGILPSVVSWSWVCFEILARKSLHNREFFSWALVSEVSEVTEDFETGQKRPTRAMYYLS